MALRTDTKLPTGVRNGPSAGGRRRGAAVHEPFGLRTVIRGFGKALICFGMLLFLFVAYELWGTGIHERRGQKDLEESFNRIRAQQLTPLPTLPGADASTAPTTTLPPVDLGEGVALIEMPSIDVSKFVVEGVDVEDLKKGPGHYPGTPLPGEKGNAAIAGHRTTYGAPFYDVNELKVGDPIFVTTAAGRFRYDVTEQLIVSPEAVEVLDDKGDDRLTLTTCNPRFSAAERLIIVARLITPPVDAAPRAAAPPTPPDGVIALPADELETVPAASLDAGLSGAAVPKGPAVTWGLIALVVWIGGWMLGRVWRRWPAYAVTAGPFLVVLYFFYENVARLLPANV